MKRNKKNKRKKLQIGGAEVAIFAILTLFAVLVTGYLTLPFNGISVNNQPNSNSSWDYILASSLSPQQAQYTLQEASVPYFTIPKIVEKGGGAGGKIPHKYGLKFNPHYVDPAVYAKKFAVKPGNTSL